MEKERKFEDFGPIVGVSMDRFSDIWSGIKSALPVQVAQPKALPEGSFAAKPESKPQESTVVLGSQ